MDDAKEHARYFLGRVDKYIGLRQAALDIRDAQPDISKWKSGELGHWCVEQAKHIAQTKSLDGIVDNDDVLTLATLGYLAIAEVDDPPKSPNTPMPSRLAKLEHGFLRTLLEEAKRDAAAVPEFRDKLETAKGSVAQLVKSLGNGSGPPPGLSAQATNNGWAVINVLAVICAVGGLVAGLTKKKKT